jgi:hypothetical protein
LEQQPGRRGVCHLVLHRPDFGGLDSRADGSFCGRLHLLDRPKSRRSAEVLQGRAILGPARLWSRQRGVNHGQSPLLRDHAASLNGREMGLRAGTNHSNAAAPSLGTHSLGFFNLPHAILPFRRFVDGTKLIFRFRVDRIGLLFQGWAYRCSGYQPRRYVTWGHRALVTRGIGRRRARRRLSVNAVELAIPRDARIPR